MYNLELDDCELNESDDCGFSVNDIKQLAKEYLSLFFTNKKDFMGGDILLQKLHSERNVSLVLNMDICGGVPNIYQSIKGLNITEKRKGKESTDVEMMLKLLKECASLCIPKCFAAGLIGVYIEICKGRRLNA